MRYETRYIIKYNNFGKIAAQMPQQAADVQGMIVLMLVAAADPRTPVGETGNLKNAKIIETGGVGKQGFVHWLAPYAGFVHNGTRYMAARPFIAQSVAQVYPIFKEAMSALAKGQRA